MRILVIEDEAKIARALKEGLEGEHYEVAVSRTGEEGFFRAISHGFPLVAQDDYEVVEKAAFLYDSLYAALRVQLEKQP